MNTTLNRTLGLPSLVIFGLAYLAPMIVLGTFGVIAHTTGGATPSAYLVALLAMLFTAHSYGRMSLAYPVAGSAYTYVRKSVDSRAGFLVGWAALLDYFFLPMVIWLIGATFLNERFPGVPLQVWILAFIVLTTALNILGIKVADKVNYLLMSFQILVLIIFVGFAIARILGDHGNLIDGAAFLNSGTGLGPITAGAAVAAYSYLGFDAVTTLTEETKSPEKNMPRAIMMVALIGGGIFVLVTYFTQLVHPGGEFSNPDAAASEIAQSIGGDLLAALFLAGLVIAQLSSGIAAQASASRLLFAMGRDGVLPRRVFGQLLRRFQTPAGNIILVGVVGLLAMFLDVSTSTSFINFGAFTAFTMVNVAVVFFFVRQRRQSNSLNVLSYLIAPVIGAVICGYLLFQLDGNALVLGVIWLAIGIVVLGIITRGFRKAPPQIHQE